MDYSHQPNTQRFSQATEANAAACVQNLSSWADAVSQIHSWPEYEPQPLRTLPNFASHMGIRKLYFKDESRRFGTTLGSFKALGAPYAVYIILADAVHSTTSVHPSSAQLRSGQYRDITQRVTVCVATDGNQGRGLAYGAKIFGCRCVDYIHNHVSAGRAEAMQKLGTVVIRVDGEYEASVERAREDARMNGWHFASSTSWSEFDGGIPRNVMNAYMVVVEETLSMIPSVEEITHVFVCGGVGSIAAAVFLGFLTRLRQTKNTELPRFIVVEPLEADCLFQSAKRGEPYISQGSLRTLMAGLACRAPSPAAWKILSWLTSDFVAVADSAAIDGMKALASRLGGDIPVVCGESMSNFLSVH